MVALLEEMRATHGLVPDRQLDGTTKAAMLMDRDLVIIGPNTRAFGGAVDPGFKDLPVPVMVSKDATGFMSLGNVAASDAHENTIVMTKTDHPLAAGLMPGTITVLTTPMLQRILSWTGVGPDAIKIANGPAGGADAWAILGYEKGGTMGNGFKAPAKRLGFFWHRPAGATDDGKLLFKAAVEWMIRP
jgi:hypothetical protein